MINNNETPKVNYQQNVVISIIQSHLDSIPAEESDYRTFLMNKIIRLQPQPKNPITGRTTKYQLIHHNIHISIQPKFERRYQYLLLNEYNGGNHSPEVITLLDRLINRSYKKVGKMYSRVNKHYEKISQYKQSLELA
jgi:hypothetical protein